MHENPVWFQIVCIFQALLARNTGLPTNSKNSMLHGNRTLNSQNVRKAIKTMNTSKDDYSLIKSFFGNSNIFHNLSPLLRSFNPIPYLVFVSKQEQEVHPAIKIGKKPIYDNFDRDYLRI